MFEVLSIIAQAVLDGTAGKPSRKSGILPACGIRKDAGPAPQEQRLPQSAAGADQRTPAAVPICQQLQPSSAAWCSPLPSQMAGRTPHAVSY